MVVTDETKNYKIYWQQKKLGFHTAFKNSLSRARLESRIVLAYVDLQTENIILTNIINMKKNIHTNCAVITIIVVKHHDSTSYTPKINALYPK
jgi:hypothetical protein